MLPKKIILEGKSYLMLEENLGRLQYNAFAPGSINAKHYSNYEPISAVGIAPIDTVTRKTIQGKKSEVQDLKFAIKFKWNVDVLLSNPDLFLRYYNYFDGANQTDNGKKGKVASQTVNDFMPFILDPVYGKTFNSFLGGEGSEDGEGDDLLMEAQEAAVADELDGFNSDEALDGAEVDDAPVGDEPVDEEKLLNNKPLKGKEYFFYLVFKYDENYDNDAKIKTASYGDGSNIEIIKLVSEGHAENPNIAITGRVLERKAVGFQKELLGILNANHKVITAAVNKVEVQVGADINGDGLIGGEEPIEGTNEELDFDNQTLPPDDLTDSGNGGDELDVDGSAAVHPEMVSDAGENSVRDSTARLDDMEHESSKAFNRFKSSVV